MRKLLFVAIVLTFFVNSSIARGDLVLQKTFTIPNIDLVYLSSHQSNLMALHNGGTTAVDEIRIYDTDTNLLSSFSTRSRYINAVTSIGNKYVFTGRTSMSSSDYLFEMDFSGYINGPVSQISRKRCLGFDGTNLLTNYGSFWPGEPAPVGVLSSTVSVVNVQDYTVVDSIDFDIDTGTSVTGTSLHGIEKYNETWFVIIFGINKLFQLDNSWNVIDTTQLSEGTWPNGMTIIGDDLFVAERNGTVYQYAVPEPTTILLLGFGSLILCRRKP